MAVIQGAAHTGYPVSGVDGWQLEHYVFIEQSGTAIFTYEKRDAAGRVVDAVEFERPVEVRHDAPVRRAA